MLMPPSRRCDAGMLHVAATLDDAAVISRRQTFITTTGYYSDDDYNDCDDDDHDDESHPATPTVTTPTPTTTTASPAAAAILSLVSRSFLFRIPLSSFVCLVVVAAFVLVRPSCSFKPDIAGCELIPDVRAQGFVTFGYSPTAVKP